MNRTLLGCSALAVVGCTTPTRPSDGAAVFSVQVPTDIEDAPNLRYALVWLEQSGARVVGGGRARGTPFDARVEWPTGIRARELQPVERMLVAESAAVVSASGHYVGPNAVYADAYRPRVVVYRDLDGDGDLTLSASSSDRILATDLYVGVAALLDPQAALKQLTLEQSRAFYANGRAYSRFLLATSNGLDLSMLSNASVMLFEGPHVERREDVLCGRYVVSGRAAVESRVLIDEGLDPDVVCPRGVAECEAGSLGALSLPDYEATADAPRYAQCRRAANLAAFSVYTGAPECSDCACNDEPVVDVYLAARDALPPWWPCGDEVEYCDDGAEVTSVGLCVEFLLGQNPSADAGVEDAGSDGGR